MSNFCLKCGKLLEKDGFCLECIELSEKDGIMKDSSEVNAAVSKEQPYADTNKKAYEQISNEQQLKQKSKVSLVKILLVVIVTVGICVAGIYVVSTLADDLGKKSATDVTSSNQTEILEQEIEESLEEEEAQAESDDSYVYEADYDEIMQAGEPSNAYTLFAATKEDVVPIIDEYFVEQGLNMNYGTDMDNTYEMVEEEKITYYETFSMWSENEDDPELYFISSDTVTGKLLYVGVYREGQEEAIKLIRKSLETIDPNLTPEQLQEICDNMINSTDYVDEICGDYEVQGGFIEEQNLYYYYIVSLLDN